MINEARLEQEPRLDISINLPLSQLMKLFDWTKIAEKLGYNEYAISEGLDPNDTHVNVILVFENKTIVDFKRS